MIIKLVAVMCVGVLFATNMSDTSFASDTKLSSVKGASAQWDEDQWNEKIRKVEKRRSKERADSIGDLAKSLGVELTEEEIAYSSNNTNMDD